MSKAADWVINRPWAITEESLSTIIAIAERRNESPEAVEAKLGRPLDNTHSVTIRDGVAIIPVVGPIARYADFFSEISGATAIETLAKDFRSALDNHSVKGIILAMDTPGGEVSGVAEFAGHVREARGRKPIVAYVGSRAQSAGYWIASAADQVIADPTAMLGSIGVVMGMRAKTGSSSTIEFVSSQSPYKRVDPATEAGRAKIQATTDDLADVFVDAVSSNRSVDRGQVLADFGQGGSLVGAKAVAAGMADGVGSLEQVIASLSKGEMPCLPKKSPARKADTQPRRAAMSEPESNISAADAAEIRKQLAEAKQARIDAEATAKARAEAMDKDMADLKAKNQSLQDAKILADARLFAEGEIRSGRAAVPERDFLAAMFVQAAQDDAAHPATKPRVDALKATYAARPVVPGGRLTINATVPPPGSTEGLTVYSPDTDPNALTPARKAELDKLAAANG